MEWCSIKWIEVVEHPITVIKAIPKKQQSKKLNAAVDGAIEENRF